MIHMLFKHLVSAEAATNFHPANHPNFKEAVQFLFLNVLILYYTCPGKYMGIAVPSIKSSGGSRGGGSVCNSISMEHQSKLICSIWFLASSSSHTHDEWSSNPNCHMILRSWGMWVRVGKLGPNLYIHTMQFRGGGWGETHINGNHVCYFQFAFYTLNIEMLLPL